MPLIGEVSGGGLRYDLDEALPDHASLTRIYERYGSEVFRHFFEKIVELCQRRVTGDRKYGTEENLVATLREQIHASVPSPYVDHRTAFWSRRPLPL